MKILPVGAELLHADGRMDGQMDGRTDRHRQTQTDRETERHNEANSLAILRTRLNTRKVVTCGPGREEFKSERLSQRP
jgi:hypothetical protein